MLEPRENIRFHTHLGGGGQVKVDLSFAHCESLQLLSSGLVFVLGLDVGLHFNGRLLIFLAEKGADRGLAVSTRASKIGRIKSSIYYLQFTSDVLALHGSFHTGLIQQILPPKESLEAKTTLISQDWSKDS